MPVYDYKCPEHGLFYELATMDEASEPAPCPDCGVSCGRVIMLAPSLFEMKASDKKAHELNEKAQHEPVYSTVDARDPHHGETDCGCHKRRPKASKLMYTADGSKMFPSMRPWMISH